MNHGNRLLVCQKKFIEGHVYYSSAITLVIRLRLLFINSLIYCSKKLLHI